MNDDVRTLAEEFAEHNRRMEALAADLSGFDNHTNDIMINAMMSIFSDRDNEWEYV